LVPSSVRLPGWPDDSDEACVSLILREVRIIPAQHFFQELDHDLCVFDLHCLAWRDERGSSRQDFDVGQDCHTCGKAYPEICKGLASEFRIPGLAGGEWVGKVMLQGPQARPLLLVRTYVAAEPGGRFAFADLVSRVTKAGADVRGWSP
jgi:hypothetical protein